ncbi:hypothetical protein EVAR_10501_1 [Eumeta japonica]|uniref:Uncharacterized protein n=1 Tax=Eumeta variegata TaxID=151549 RepID=A0A4C1TKN1_EUMVA|nr:hypothetical protein EVAR_10501_1 [Eumeta japonica]
MQHRNRTTHILECVSRRGSRETKRFLCERPRNEPPDIFLAEGDAPPATARAVRSSCRIDDGDEFLSLRSPASHQLPVSHQSPVAHQSPASRQSRYSIVILFGCQSARLFVPRANAGRD